MYEAMLDRIEEEVVRYLFLLQPVMEEEIPERKEQPVFYREPRRDGPPPRPGKQARSVIPKKRKKKKKKN